MNMLTKNLAKRFVKRLIKMAIAMRWKIYKLENVFDEPHDAENIDKVIALNKLLQDIENEPQAERGEEKTMHECFHCGKVNLSYVEWLEKLVAEYQPEWICDELVGCSDEWCENNCKSDWNSECLKRYYARHFDTADTP